MKLSELKDQYSYFKVRKNETYSLYHKKSCPRWNQTYLCEFKVKGTKVAVVTGKEEVYVSKLEQFIEQVNSYVNSLTYASHYYIPNLNKGCFAEFIVMDYLSEIGFKHSNDSYVLKRKDIYGKESEEICLSFYNLDAFEYDKSNNEVVTIIYHVSWGSWVEVNVEREPAAIINAIQSLLKPVLITNSAMNMKVADNMNFNPITLKLTEAQNLFNVTEIEVEQKTLIKNQLQEMLTALG